VSSKSYEFGPFRVDVEQSTLLQDGRPIPLTPKAFDTLVLLVENAGRLLEKEAMMERLWPGTFVEEANLANNISLLRKALGDSGNLIQTVPRRGYRFIGELRGSDAPAPQRRRWPLFVAGAALLALGIGLLLLDRHRDPPVFRQITFRRGIHWGARFQADGATIIYSAVHEGRPSELFIARADQRESRPLGIAGDLLSISSHGDLAILTKSSLRGFFPVGTLARVPITGGAPRELATNVQEADWSPDGSALAVIRWDGLAVLVEYPMGHVIYRATVPVWVNRVRVAPDGEHVAFLLHESERFDDRGRAVVVDRNGKIVRSSRVFATANGLAWRGEHLWISAAPDDLNAALYDVDRRGHDRALVRSAGRLDLFDVSPTGRALVANEDIFTGIVAVPPGETRERDLSWLDGSWIRDISLDGKTLLFDEEGSGGGATAHVYIRPIDGAPAVDLGEGHAVALSPDGRTVLARQRFTNPPRLILYSTGAGEPRPLRTGSVEPSERAAWLPDGKRIVFVGHEGARPPRTYLLDAGRVTAITPEGVIGIVVTPDGKNVLAHTRGGEWHLYPFGGIPGPALAGADEWPLRFRSDGRAFFLARGRDIVSADADGGNRATLYTLGAPPPGNIYTTDPVISADGAAYAYTYNTVSTELFVVEGLR
jgi:DNA-binding winged helix-turn-helix (wHTH) protein/dipeptidyl aminopeptidase/acylaminoacyl peptidase